MLPSIKTDIAQVKPQNCVVALQWRFAEAVDVAAGAAGREKMKYLD